MWKSSKKNFRQKYYEKDFHFETAETIFGKEIAEKLENGEEVIEGVEKYETAEKRLKVVLTEGLPLLGYLDGFTEDTLKIVEIKTGHLSKQGKCPWDAVKVRKHKQLVWYTLMVKLEYGSYNPIVTLQWLETEFKKKSVEFDGHTLEATTRELGLTGKIESFDREMRDWELDKLKEDILLVAEEISNDYTEWQNQTTTKQ